jgi:hypothetical protein
MCSSILTIIREQKGGEYILLKLVALVTAVVFSFGLGVVYAEDGSKMPWENLSKGATITIGKKKVNNKTTGKKAAKIDKEKKMGNEKEKKVAKASK